MGRHKITDTDIEVYASDCKEIAEKIEEALATRTADKRSPHKGSWKSFEKRLDEAANVLWQIWHDMNGDQ